MKLHEIPRGSRVMFVENADVPIGGLPVEEGDVLTLITIDGMYSLCRDADGNAVHPVAWADVEVL